ncbi:MAG: hypothetical protein ABS46_01705 [Cytophagaceae bacterium SCN 52-12]|nr:MAG: hypothetical protein ABS46_01705 [Cytophagaceae bacterium SCN 52-12]
MDRDADALWEETFTDVASLAGPKVRGKIRDWRTDNVYYRDCSYAIEQPSEMNVRYGEDFIQFLFLLRGKRLATCFETEDCAHLLTAGEFVFFLHPRNAARSVFVSKCPFQQVSVVNIPASSFFGGHYNDVGLGEKLVQGMFMGPVRITPDLLDCIARLNRLSERSSLYRSRLLDVNIRELVLLALEAYEAQIQHAVPKSEQEILEKMSRVERLLAGSPEREYSLKQLAEYSLTNTTFLKSRFKQIYGQTVFEYLTTLRMKKAMVLLQSGDMPIADVAAATGYRYATHFTAAFKKYYGVLPKNFRHYAAPLNTNGIALLLHCLFPYIWG